MRDNTFRLAKVSTWPLWFLFLLYAVSCAIMAAGTAWLYVAFNGESDGTFLDLFGQNWLIATVILGVHLGWYEYRRQRTKATRS